MIELKKTNKSAMKCGAVVASIKPKKGMETMKDIIMGDMPKKPIKKSSKSNKKKGK